MTGLTHRLAGLSCYLTETLDRLTNVSYCLACAFPNLANGLPGSLADLANGLPSAFAQLADSLTGALADVADGLPRAFANLAHGLIGSFAELADRLTGPGTDVLNSSARAFTYVLDRLTGLAEGLPSASSHIFDRAPQALDELGVAVDRGEDPINDRRDAVEPDFQQGLRLDAFDVDSELTEMRVDSRVEFDQVEDLCFQGNASIEIVELEVDRIDLDDRNVEENVGIASRVLDVS